MGYARRLAERLNLSTVVPRNDLASTGYCLADPGKEYLVYQSESGEAFSVELKAGTYQYEWFDPAKGETADSGRIQSSGQAQQFKAPFEGDAVLFIQAQ